MAIGKYYQNRSLYNTCTSFSCSLIMRRCNLLAVSICLSLSTLRNLLAVCDDLETPYATSCPNTYLLTPLTLLHLDIWFILGVTTLAVISTLDNVLCQKIWVGSWGNSSLCHTTARKLNPQCFDLFIHSTAHDTRAELSNRLSYLHNLK